MVRLVLNFIENHDAVMKELLSELLLSMGGSYELLLLLTRMIERFRTGSVLRVNQYIENKQRDTYVNTLIAIINDLNHRLAIRLDIMLVNKFKF